MRAPSKRTKELIETVTKEIERSGITEYEVSYGGKHIAVKWTGKDGVFVKDTIAISSSDWRSEKNALSGLRKKLGISRKKNRKSIREKSIKSFKPSEHNWHPRYKMGDENWKEYQSKPTIVNRQQTVNGVSIWHLIDGRPMPWKLVGSIVLDARGRRVFLDFNGNEKQVVADVNAYYRFIKNDT